MNLAALILFSAATLLACTNACGADQIFSGPQPGERTTPFKVVTLTGPGEGSERDPIAENAGAPTALIFIHAIERSLVPLLRVIDQYGADRQDRLKTEIVFLFADRLEGEKRGKAVARSLQLRSRVGLSVDAAEGPGNYGLNKECMMTVIAAKDNKVTANFALVQPGITDGARIIDALARTCGDQAPPSVAQLSERHGGKGGSRERAGGMQADRDTTKASGTEQGIGTKPKEAFPGAVPTDAKLNSLLRQIIRPANDEATVDRLMVEMSAYIKSNTELSQQALDGWIRILHFGDHYGTAYARKLGRAQLEALKTELAPGVTVK